MSDKTRQIPLIKSRDFDTKEVARSAMIVDDIGMVLTGYAMGYVQVLRDACAKKFGKRFQGLEVTSSNRNGYNDQVPGSAKNSHHIWRIDSDRKLHVALDLKPKGITLHEFYNLAVTICRGEIYLNSKEGIVHVALVPQEDEAWVQ